MASCERNVSIVHSSQKVLQVTSPVPRVYTQMFYSTLEKNRELLIAKLLSKSNFSIQSAGFFSVPDLAISPGGGPLALAPLGSKMAPS